MADEYYATGTASVTAGAASVAGQGTTWAANARAGDLLIVDGATGMVASVEENGALTLVEPWGGDSASGSPYVLMRGVAWVEGVSNLIDLVQLLNRLRQVTRLHLVSGSPSADLGLPDHVALDPDTGRYYVKTAGGWEARADLDSAVADATARAEAAALAAANVAANIDDPLSAASVLPSLRLRLDPYGDLPAGWTFARASSATRVDHRGLIEEVGLDELRHDFDPASGRYLGALLEEGRTNLLEWSEDLTQAAWVVSSMSVEGDSAPAPNGSQSAARLVEDTNVANHYIRQYRPGSEFADGAIVAGSVFVRGGERSEARVALRTKSGALPNVYVDLASGSIIATYSSPLDVFVVAYPGGWYRVVVIADIGAGATSPGLLVYSSVAGNSNYAGDGASGLYAWGWQLEAGAWPSSYIPTEAGAVTRAGDQLSHAVDDWFNSRAGVLWADGDFQSGVADSIGAIAFLRQASSSGFGVAHIAGTWYAGLRPNAASPYLLAGSAGIMEPFRLAGRYSEDGGAIAQSLNGAPASVDASVAQDWRDYLPTQLRVGWGVFGGSGSDDIRLNGHIRDLAYFPAALSDAELAAITARPGEPE